MDDDNTIDTPLRQDLVAGCALDADELDERLHEIERLTRSALVERKDTAGSTVLTFDRAAAARLRDLVERERACCGHLDFAIEEDNGLIRLAIRRRSDE